MKLVTLHLVTASRISGQIAQIALDAFYSAPGDSFRSATPVSDMRQTGQFMVKKPFSGQKTQVGTL
jgi:hypothetical protein